MALCALLLALCALTDFSAADPIKSSQQIVYDTPEVQGRPFQAKPIRPKTRFVPQTVTLHRDGGNTRSEDFDGPLGNNIIVNSSDNAFPSPWLFDDTGKLAAGSICPTEENPQALCIITMDPDSFDILDKWILPVQSSYGIIGFTYMTLTGNRILVPGANVAWELERGDDDKLSLIRTIDFTDILGQDQGVLQTILYDKHDNLWFTNGGFPGAGAGAGISKVLVGYLTPDGRNHTVLFEDQIIENSVAVSGDTVYVVTGPAGKADTANATGYLYVFRPCADGVQTVSKTEYKAGSAIKKNGFSRGSGTSPNLLGERFVAITDNADEQVNLLIYPQAGPESRADGESVDPVCSAPLWAPGESANEITFVNHFDGTNYAIITANCYHIPFPLYTPGSDLPINGDWNNYNVMGPGTARIDVVPLDDGSVQCKLRWNQTEARTTAVNTLSTKTGLMYNYYQDLELAETGQYVWYVVASDLETGEFVWKVRTGAGGTFNVNFQTPALSPNGCIYIMVNGGFVRVCDGK